MFNALTVSGLRAPQTSPVTTTALFAPLDPSRQPNRKDMLQLRRSAIALAKELSTDRTAEGYIGLIVQGPTYNCVAGNTPVSTPRAPRSECAPGRKPTFSLPQRGKSQTTIETL